MPVEGPIGTVVPPRHTFAREPSRGLDPSAPTRAGLRASLVGILDDLGFDTASLFVSSPDGWRLLVREGPRRPWHAVLDPTALEGTPQSAEYPDARTIPGIGPRLAELGCASVAMLPVPDGGRLLLDSRAPCLSDGWIERARPYISLTSIMSGPQWPAGGAMRSHEEVASLQRVFAACQEALAREGTSPGDLLDAVRDAIRADEFFFITKLGGGLMVAGFPSREWPHRLSRKLVSALAPSATPTIDDETVRQIAIALGASSRALTAAHGRDDAIEVIVAGWTAGPALSPISTNVLARATSMALAALEARERVVHSLVGHERAKIAYALHDGLTQTVTGAILELEALAKRVQRDPAEALETLETSKTEIRRSLAEIRSWLTALTEEGDDEELRSAAKLRQDVDDVVRRWRLPARIDIDGDLEGVPARVLSVAYVVIREALANAAKHSLGTSVTVTLTASASDLTVIVGDDGQGFTRQDELSAREADHVGLDWLRQRVRDAGGRLYVHPRPGKGTRVVARIPLRQAAS